MDSSVPVLHGQTVLVTGAGRGLGAALAICLADIGCRVILSGRDSRDLDRVSLAIRKRTSQDSCSMVLDLADLSSLEEATSRLIEREHAIDILVHNGAQWLSGRNSPYTVQEVSAVVGSMITGTFLLTQMLLPALLQSKAPQILAIGSANALHNAPLLDASVPFHAAKQGQAGMMQGLGEWLSAYPIRLHSIHPPHLTDVSPLDVEWTLAPSSGRMTNRDVVETAIFALSQARHVSLPTVVLRQAGS